MPLCLGPDQEDGGHASCGLTLAGIEMDVEEGRRLRHSDPLCLTLEQLMTSWCDAGDPALYVGICLDLVLIRCWVPCGGELWL